MTYLYSRDNPAANRAHYMYAAYGGFKFLADYCTDRQSLLELLPLSRSAPSLDTKGTIAVSLLPSRIDTLEALTECATSEIGSAGRIKLVKFFLRKIEVTRQLRRAYTSQGRAGDEQEAALGAYILAADLFADELLISQGHAKLRWFNALLKTNDVLSYRRDEVRAEILAYAARRPITIELTSVAQTATELGIDITQWNNCDQ